MTERRDIFWVALLAALVLATGCGRARKARDQALNRDRFNGPATGTGTGSGTGTGTGTVNSGTRTGTTSNGTFSRDGSSLLSDVDIAQWLGLGGFVPWTAVTTPPAPLCGYSYSTQATVYFYNGTAHSTMAHVAFPAACSNPVITTQTVSTSILCGNGAGPTTCVNAPGTTSRRLYSYVGQVTSTGANVFLSTEDGVWVGASSPGFVINVNVTCAPVDASACLGAFGQDPTGTIAGKAHVAFYNSRAVSEPTRVSFPISCPNARVVAQTRSDSILCGDQKGPTVCQHAANTTSRDLHVVTSDIDSTGFTVRLAAEDGVWVGSVSPAFRIDYVAACDTPAPPPIQGFHSGRAYAYFYNGHSYSTMARVSLPPACENPRVFTQSAGGFIHCGNGAGPTPCANAPKATARVLRSYYANLTSSTVDLLVSAEDGVWVGATSPAFPIDYQIVCRPRRP